MRRLPLACLLALAALCAPAAAAERPHLELVGALHEHSGYSDGWPGTRPLDVFESAKAAGNDFVAGSEHSTNMALPSTFNESCYGEGRGGEGEVLLAQCALADGADSLRKWDATAEQAASVTDGSFAAIRGFEWSSDRFGHLNVYFSRNWVNELDGGGYAGMAGFWRWFTTPPARGGGADGLGTFNHPSAKRLEGSPTEAADLDWNGFRYVPEADERMVGLEVFNDRRDHGSDTRTYPAGPYVAALDRGWHVGAIGAEDLGHRKPPLDDWGGPSWPKTVVLAHDRTPQGIRAALLDRRFYAVGPGEGRTLRLSYTVDGAAMGSRLERAPRDRLRFLAAATDPAVRLELVTSGGRVVASRRGRLRVRRRAAAGERWYFVRALRDGRPVAYSSPVWVETVRGGPRGEWLAGDGHVHTCYSHDSYCPPDDDNTGPDTLYSSFATVGQRFAEAAAKGLDFLVISDHNDVRAWSDPSFGAHGVLGVHAYEHSLPRGHAHVVGARRYIDVDDPAALAAAARADGALFQVNHPVEGAERDPAGCAEIDAGASEVMDWRYGASVRPDLLEVWNATTLLSGAEAVWECWLNRGWRLPATAGSDSHGGNQANLGVPTLWVLARDRSEPSILAALRAGRTTLARVPPGMGAVRLLLEADRDGDGSYEATMGDAVAPGTAMRVRADGLAAAGTVRVRANGRTLLEERLAPGGSVTFAAPAQPGWVRASLLGQQATAGSDPSCRAGSPSPIDLCTASLTSLALTSPIYVEPPA